MIVDHRLGAVRAVYASVLLLSMLVVVQPQHLSSENACSPSPGTAAPPAARFSRHIADWHYADVSLATNRRFWDFPSLLRAINVASFDQMRPVLAKLHGGQPVTVFTIGSSVAMDYGGAFQPSIQAVADAVPLPNPAVYWPNSTTGQLSVSIGVLRDGWMRLFMEGLNATFPHPGHLLINGGAQKTIRLKHASTLQLHVMPSVVYAIYNVIGFHECNWL